MIIPSHQKTRIHAVLETTASVTWGTLQSADTMETIAARRNLIVTIVKARIAFATPMVSLTVDVSTDCILPVFYSEKISIYSAS